ncbi:hypothetical protein OL548_22470 [Lysinibacillus sp. MHQ-1]|nr:hypothetical protein OL548_22470 [Lysinibacillus sp. MHQ-1]
MIVALLGSFVLFVPLFAGFIIIGLQSGFGNFNLPSPMYAPHLDWRQEGKFEPMTLGMFLGQTLILLLTWFMVIINVVLLFSILFRNEMMNVAIGLLLILGGEVLFQPICWLLLGYSNLSDLVHSSRTNCIKTTKFLLYERLFRFQFRITVVTSLSCSRHFIHAAYCYE